MNTIREYLFKDNRAKIKVSLQEDHEYDNFVLSFEREDDVDVAIAMRADEALIVSSMLSQAVAMACSAYNIEIDTDAEDGYANTTPLGGRG